MPRYNQSLMDTYGFRETYLATPCVVEISDDGNVVSVIYKDFAKDKNGEEVEKDYVYEGEKNSSGYFELICEANEGKATLHPCSDQETLEGSWQEVDSNGKRTRGLWRIMLRNFSPLNEYYDDALRIFKKIVHCGISELSLQERKKSMAIMEKMSEIFEKHMCYRKYRDCVPGVCDFSRGGEQWIAFKGYDNLCDLICNFDGYDVSFNKIKCELYNTKKIIPGSVTQ